MNKFFILAVIIFSFISLIWHFFDIKNYPNIPKGTIDEIANFPKEFPNIKSVGFSSDNDEIAHILYRVQNTIIPVFVEYSKEKGIFFCYSTNNYCAELIQSKKAELLKVYTKELILLKESGIK